MKKEEVEIPKEKPKRVWEGYQDMKSVEEIQKKKVKIDWDAINEDDQVYVNLTSLEEKEIEQDTKMVLDK